MNSQFRTKGSLPTQDVFINQPIQVYGDVGVDQPISVYFDTPPTVNIPEPVSVYFASPQPVTGNLTSTIQQPLSVYGTTAFGLEVYLAPGSPPIISNNAQPPFQIYGSQPGVQVYGNVGIPEPVSVYFATPQPITGTVAATVQQPFSVYGQTSFGLEVYLAPGSPPIISNNAQPPYQVYGSQSGIQVYGNVGIPEPVSVYFATPQAVTVPQPLSVYHATPQADYLTQPAQIYGNVGVQQPLSVYGATSFGVEVYMQSNAPAHPVTFQQPLSVYGQTVFGVEVYQAPNAPPHNIYDSQVVSDANQVFAGQIPANFGANFQMVPAQAGQSFEATLVDIWNIYGAAETVALRYGTGTFRFIKKLNPNTGFAVNLVNSTWRGPTNTALNVYAWETMGGPLSASGGFLTYTVMGQYLP